MSWNLRILGAVVIIALAVAAFGFGLVTHPLFSYIAVICGSAAVAAILLAPSIARFLSSGLVDLIYSAQGSPDSLPTDDVERRRQVARQWKITLAVFYLAMLAGLYGIYWGWPGVQAIIGLREATAGLPDGAGPRALVFVLCAVPWAIFVFGYFLPLWWGNVDAAYVRWRHGAPEPYDYDGSRARAARAHTDEDADTRDERDPQGRASLWRR